MSTHDQVLSDFIDEWNTGHRPRVREYLARLPDGPERDELADQITTWLEVAPTPAYDEETRLADPVRADRGPARSRDRSRPSAPAPGSPSPSSRHA